MAAPTPSVLPPAVVALAPSAVAGSADPRPTSPLHASPLHASPTSLGLLAQGDAAEQPMSPLQRFLANPLILPIGLLVLFYVIFLGPERRRKAEEAKLLSSLKKNDRVVTIGGIHATVASAPSDGDVVTLKIDESSNTRIRVNRTAIARIVNETNSTTSSTKSTPKAKDATAETKDA